MKPGELEARESIRDLVARYNANGDAGRLDAVLELFAEDAVLEVPGETLRGRAAIRAFMARVASGAGGPPGPRVGIRQGTPGGGPPGTRDARGRPRDLPGR